MTMPGKNYDFLDLLKMVLILMVLAIHAPLSTGISMGGIDLAIPIFRMAVPLFFLMSSYFFFGKYQRCDGEGRRVALLKFIKRNLFLYLIWFVICLPVTVYLKWDWWFGGGLLKGCVCFFLNVFFGGTFFASWFIMALVIATAGAVFLSRKFGNRMLLFVGIAMYAVAIFSSCYSPVIAGIRESPLTRGFVLLAPNSFLSAFVWVVMGKIVAEKGYKASRLTGILAVVSMMLYFAEAIFVARFVGRTACDCYVSLMPVCFSAFVFLKNVSVSIPYSKVLRSMSTVFYVLHGSAFVVIAIVLGRVGVADPRHIIKYLLGCVVCILAFLILRFLSRMEKLSWLKYAY